MKEHNKRWLISMMKTSGSKRRRLINGSFSSERNTKKYKDIENLPSQESIKRTSKMIHGKLNYGLLVRFLRGQVGNDWNEVYSEVISRIPTKLLDYKEIVFRFVADKIDIVDGHPYNKESNKFVWTPEQGDYNFSFDNSYFYVCPMTNKLMRVEDKPSKRVTKSMEKTELSKYRENRKNEKLREAQQKKVNTAEIEEFTRMKLSESNAQKRAATNKVLPKAGLNCID